MRLPKTLSARAEAETGFCGVPEGVAVGVLPPIGVQAPPVALVPLRGVGALAARARDAAAPVIRLDFGGERPSTPSNS